MHPTTSQIIKEIERFTPVDDSWLPLDDLLGKLFQQTVTAEGITAVLGVLERFPTEDGAGVFWTIVHGLESIQGYEPYLIDSVRRRPSETSVIMLNRILKAGQRDAGGVSIHSVLAEVAANPAAEPSVRRYAESFLLAMSDNQSGSTSF